MLINVTRQECALACADARYGDVWVLLKGQRSFALLRMTYMVVYSYNVNIIFAVSFRVTRTWTYKEYPSFSRISYLESEECFAFLFQHEMAWFGFNPL